MAELLVDEPVDLRVISRKGDERRWIDKGITDVHGLVAPARPLRLAQERFLLGRRGPVTECDVWHGPHYTMPHSRKGATVVTICDMTFFTNPEWHERRKVPFFRNAIRYAAEHADGLIAISEFTKRQFLELCPTDTPVTVATLGVELERFRPLESDEVTQSAFDLEVPYILCVGTLEPRKGLDVLLESFRQIASDVPDVELWVVGQMGWGVEDWKARVASHPYASRVRTLGYVADDELPKLVRHARALAYPSRGEGFGLPVIEGLASGVPVVTTAGTVMEEIAQGHAHLVPIGDAEALATALTTELTRSEADRAERGRQARLHAELFTWDATAKAHVRAYQDAFERRSGKL
jgi:glycosyltransferase involved in cell wall biosynthesis